MSFLGKLDQRFLLTPKLIYFAVGSVYYLFYIFRVKFCKAYYGFGVVEAGEMGATISLAGFLCMPLWSWLADRTKSHRLVLMVLGVLATATFELFLFKVASVSHRYWYSLGVSALFGGVLGGLLPLADFQILQLLTKRFKVSRTLYGRQRMMGTVSYGLMTRLVGTLIDWTGDVTILFVLFPLFSTILLVLLLSFGYPDTQQQPSQETDTEMQYSAAKAKDKEASLEGTPQSPPQPTASSLVFFKDFHFVFFLLVVFVTGCGRQVLQVYLPPFLEDPLGMSGKQVGNAIISSCVFSIVFLFVGADLIRILGTHAMLFLGMVTMAIRLGLYYWVPHDPSSSLIVYSIELLNGVAFSFTHLAGVKTAADFAPKGLEATAQAVYTSAYMQLPAVIISFAGGRIFKHKGALFLFSRSALTLLGFAVVTGITFLIQASRKQAPSR